MHRKKRLRKLLISRITYKEWGLGVRESAIAFRNFGNYLYLIIWGESRRTHLRTRTRTFWVADVRRTCFFSILPFAANYESNNAAILIPKKSVPYNTNNWFLGCICLQRIDLLKVLVLIRLVLRVASQRLISDSSDSDESTSSIVWTRCNWNKDKLKVERYCELSVCIFVVTLALLGPLHQGGVAPKCSKTSQLGPVNAYIRWYF